jgi:tetratricopeptide (TPR) repeat protein
MADMTMVSRYLHFRNFSGATACWAGSCLLAFGMLVFFSIQSNAQVRDVPGDGQSPPAMERQTTPNTEPRPTPLQRLMKGGVPDNAIERAALRDNLYALLATAPDKKSADQIASTLERVSMVSGSATVDLLMLRVLQADKAKKSDVALEILNGVLEQAPDYAEAWNRRAYLHYKARDYRAALGDLRRTLALDPKHYKALSGLGTILRDSGDDAAALEVYERLMDINPFAQGAKDAYDELKRKVEGRGI